MTKLRHSIAFRLFAVTFAAMLLFVGILLLALAGGFSSFYERQQKKDIASDLNKIRDRYANAAQLFPGKGGFPPYFGQFEDEYSATLALVTLQGGLTQIMIGGGGAPASGAGAQSVPLKIGNRDSASVFVLPKGPNMDRAERLGTALESWRQDAGAFSGVMREGKTLVYRADTGGGTAGALLIAVTALTTDGTGNGKVLFALSSLQPVTNAASVFRDLSLYVFAFAFVVVGLLAVGYAALVTRPLRRLNGIAGRLASLDFSTRSGWKRKDEIGELSRTFDFLADNLQGTLAELTSANEKLRLDIENEKRLERMRREFVAGVSHELKTPLSLVGGYAEGLRDNIGSGAKREKYAEVILEETRRMASIVGDMLDLSQLESGRYSLKREAFDVAELLNEAADRAEAYAAGSGKSVRVNVRLPEPPAEPPRAYADRLRIGQVLTNLATNAVRHAAEGGAIEFSAAPEGGRWTIYVRNDGEPIPEEELTRIWGQFYRIDRSRSRDSGGTGIGLAIVRQILELHGSRYGVRNEPGGVVFAFTLQTADGDAGVRNEERTG
ncbi:HAMP domain-containing protein [Cohnella xylanilytica]|uniref:histidine kinase n=1 Tax=Cohnella xylanilytica TaxID=557555 RepID=A0A841TY63_9BACL|nr:ATP-binding protein [Cohnella xylanilytica]MBB6690861.1 HAMP domain-containing protein [Cohnella xylanilytica]